MLLEVWRKGWNEGIVFRKQMIDIYGWIQRKMGKLIVYDSDNSKTVVMGDDCKLYYKGNVTGEDDEDTMWQNADKLIEMKRYCNSHGICFLFVIAPDKYNKNVKLPIECKDYFETTCAFTEKLKNSNVNSLNLQEKLTNEYDNYSDGFFVTDHHWNIHTAFWGFQCIAENLNDVYGANVAKELFNKENYSSEVVKRDFLGSMGIRVGKYYAGEDSVELIAPKFKTSFSVKYNTKTRKTAIHREGSFVESLIEKGNGYNMYITSDNSFIHVDNKLNNDGKRIMLIKDSFGLPIAAWLSCICDELYEVDLRYKQELSVIDMLKKYDIDTFIILYNPGMLGTGFAFDFYKVSAGK